MKGRYLAVIFLLLLCAWPLSSYANIDSLLHELSQTIREKEKYMEQKSERLEQLKKILRNEPDLSLTEQFEVYNKLYFEYRTFKYDSAFKYVLQLQDVAHRLNDPIRITHAKLNQSFILLSSGMFKEALDSLNTIQPAPFPDSIKIEFYALKARAFYDLSSYTEDTYYANRYIKAGESYIDSAFVLIQPNTLAFYTLRGMKQEIANNHERARQDFQTILDKFQPSLRQYAMAANSLGHIYQNMGEPDKALEMLTRAAIADMRSSTKEGVALMTLAEMLYHRGEEALAYDYIKQALEDATFYGAKQRKIQVAAILPVIEGERLATVEGQRSRLYVYSVAVTILSVLVILFAVIIFRQLKQLREVKRTVTEANNSLQQLNESLMEANRIKEEYIGYSFNVYSEYLDKIEKFKKSIDKKLMVKKYDEINHVMKSINLKKEREALYLSFDKIFMKLFPNFVPAFNSYFNEEDKIVIKDNQSLNIELRIFALIRIGIHDHEQIARILEYSVNTIYTYKTRVKNRSFLPNEEFEKRIMEIKAF
ncbi:tetratricopeptide repeat protein [Pontibacter qinzhouensis]|uniref:Tetratricopeptide repeat protein n=1 Tax=Pontibacter qinzhouensis TaxID=2603253 RepID=A0A5C8JH65_9BACT|nr:DUF6377 domain-containing protein [Pontibacter qinzhouensis]TXK36721.1 tetratricopeptide repeat protein [Pontibacter qinzhouensis]